MTGLVILLLCLALAVVGMLLADAVDDANRGWDRALELEHHLAALRANTEEVAP